MHSITVKEGAIKRVIKIDIVIDQQKKDWPAQDEKTKEGSCLPTEVIMTGGGWRTRTHQGGTTERKKKEWGRLLERSWKGNHQGTTGETNGRKKLW